jgi:hypothetical protein
MKNNTYMMIDVESVGLHGEGFAVGWVVIRNGEPPLEYGMLACDPSLCKGNEEGREWIANNVPNLEINCSNPDELRWKFWKKWEEFKEKGAVMVADCAWPVEARFLLDCVNDDPVNREWNGPYPLHDLASMIFMLGGDPLAVTSRRSDELPKHHPLKDAIQSARIMMQCMDEIYIPLIA